jgi:hypothetical protein
MFELSHNLERILVFIIHELPQMFLQGPKTIDSRIYVDHSIGEYKNLKEWEIKRRNGI